MRQVGGGGRGGITSGGPEGEASDVGVGRYIPMSRSALSAPVRVPIPSYISVSSTKV